VGFVNQDKMSRKEGIGEEPLTSRPKPKPRPIKSTTQGITIDLKIDDKEMRKGLNKFTSSLGETAKSLERFGKDLGKLVEKYEKQFELVKK